MASDEIVIVYAFLDTLASKARDVASMLESSSKVTNLTFPKNPEVTSAYQEFLGRWDKHRGELQKSATGLAQAFTSVSEAFNKVEDVLVAAMNGKG